MEENRKRKEREDDLSGNLRGISKWAIKRRTLQAVNKEVEDLLRDHENDQHTILHEESEVPDKLCSLDNLGKNAQSISVRELLVILTMVLPMNFHVRVETAICTKLRLKILRDMRILMMNFMHRILKLFS